MQCAYLGQDLSEINHGNRILKKKAECRVSTVSGQADSSPSPSKQPGILEQVKESHRQHLHVHNCTSTSTSTRQFARAMGYVNVSFILHPSSFILHPSLSIVNCQFLYHHRYSAFRTWDALALAVDRLRDLHQSDRRSENTCYRVDSDMLK